MVEAKETFSKHISGKNETVCANINCIYFLLCLTGMLDANLKTKHLYEDAKVDWINFSYFV